MDDYEFTQAQRKAIERLSRALLSCKKVGLALRGLDDDLLAIPLKEAIKRGHSPELDDHDAWQGSWNIEHDGVYIDSGGW